MIIKIPKLPRSKPGAASPIPPAYRPWLMASLAILILSLLVLTIVAGVAFLYYANVLTPLRLMLLGAVSVGGVVLGFGGLFLLLAIGAYTSFKEEKK